MNVMVLMSDEFIDNRKEDRFLTNQQLVHYSFKIQVYTLSVVSMLKANADNKNDLIVLT